MLTYFRSSSFFFAVFANGFFIAWNFKHFTSLWVGADRIKRVGADVPIYKPKRGKRKNRKVAPGCSYYRPHPVHVRDTHQGHTEINPGLETTIEAEDVLVLARWHTAD